jgi:hypothetical protein
MREEEKQFVPEGVTASQTRTVVRATVPVDVTLNMGDPLLLVIDELCLIVKFSTVNVAVVNENIVCADSMLMLMIVPVFTPVVFPAKVKLCVSKEIPAVSAVVALKRTILKVLLSNNWVLYAWLMERHGSTKLIPHAAVSFAPVPPTKRVRPMLSAVAVGSHAG